MLSLHVPSTTDCSLQAPPHPPCASNIYLGASASQSKNRLPNLLPLATEALTWGVLLAIKSGLLIDNTLGSILLVLTSRPE